VKNLHQILCGKGIYYQRRVYGDSEGSGSGDEEKIEWKGQIKSTVVIVGLN